MVPCVLYRKSPPFYFVIRLKSEWTILLLLSNSTHVPFSPNSAKPYNLEEIWGQCQQCRNHRWTISEKWITHRRVISLYCPCDIFHADIIYMTCWVTCSSTSHTRTHRAPFTNTDLLTLEYGLVITPIIIIQPCPKLTQQLLKLGRGQVITSY